MILENDEEDHKEEAADAEGAREGNDLPLVLLQPELPELVQPPRRKRLGANRVWRGRGGRERRGDVSWKREDGVSWVGVSWKGGSGAGGGEGGG